MALLLFLAAHIFLYIGILIIKAKSGHRDRFPAVAVLCLPVTGPILWLTDRILLKASRDNSKSLDLEKLKVTDARYRKLEIEEAVDQEETVPLEEALVMNDPKLRRRLMLNILHGNPEEYLDMLKKASSSDDVEVTHYATTTLSEIQGEYELEIQRRGERCRREPENNEAWQDYRDMLLLYVNSGLLTGTVQKMQCRNLLEALEKLLETEKPNKEDIYLYIEQSLELQEYEKAEKMLLGYGKDLENDERYYKLYVRYAWELGDRELLSDLLRQIKDREVYLSREGKSWYAFWRGQDTEEDAR